MVGGHWKCFHSISRHRKPYKGHQNFRSRPHRKKVCSTTNEWKGSILEVPKKWVRGVPKFGPAYFPLIQPLYYNLKQ